MSNNNCGNITGSTSNDLSNLVNNLTQIVQNLQVSFNSVQSSISSINVYDNNNDANINQIRIITSFNQ